MLNGASRGQYLVFQAKLSKFVIIASSMRRELEHLLWKNQAARRAFGVVLAGAVLNVSIQENLSRIVPPPAVESNLANITSIHPSSVLMHSTSGPLILSVQEQQKHLVPNKLIIQDPQQAEQLKVLESPKPVVSASPVPSLEPQIIVPAPKPTENPTPTLQPQVKESKEVSFESSVLYYHEISPVQLRSDLMNLISKGYKSLSLERYAAILRGEESVPQYPTFLVTFDDGLKSQLKAIPVIEEIKKQTGDQVFLTFFSIMKFGGMDDKTIAQMVNHKPVNGEPYWGNTPSFFDGTHEYLTALDLVTLQKREEISVQPHSMDHFNYTKLSEEELRNQVLPSEIRANQVWEAAGKKRTVKATAYPLGAYNTAVANLLARFGIELAFTTEGRTLQNSSKRETEPRIRKSYEDIYRLS